VLPDRPPAQLLGAAPTQQRGVAMHTPSLAAAMAWLPYAD
jgi:hypothetical protein